jgi:DNA-binding MarR family transcriptional regulator
MRKNRNRDADYRALADFRYEIRRYLNFGEQAARAAGTEPQQYQALLAIKGMPQGQEPTVGYLAEQLQVQHHSAVELTDRLEKHRLIRRLRSRADRREVFLHLMPCGENLLRRLSLAHREELQLAGPKLLEALDGVVAHRNSPARRRKRKSEKQGAPRFARRDRRAR